MVNKHGGQKRQLGTPSKRNFLRVCAQMHNLDKQKTKACFQNVSGHCKKTTV